jgi:2-methylisocitrate lyase-like PEP mutase family enzyme
MMSETTKIFRKLHDNRVPLVLANAWDAGSARVIENLGAPAVATTSGGMAWALGYADGRLLPVDEYVAAAARMMRVVKVPLTFDIENGYSDVPKEVAKTVLRLVEVGAAGINIEDGPDEPALLAAKIDAIRRAVIKAGADVFINARSDVYLASLVAKPKLVEESIARGKQYANAGADGLFLPGLTEAADIQAIVAETAIPLNVMAWPGLAGAAELGKLGVRRLSAGTGISQAVWGRTEALAAEFLKDGKSDPMGKGAKAYGELQDLFIEK